MAKKKRNRDRGRVTRLSTPVITKLDKKKIKVDESYDSVLRRLLGIKSRKGENPQRDIFWVLPKALKVRKTEQEARGEAVLDAVAKGKRSPEKPVKVVKDD